MKYRAKFTPLLNLVGFLFFQQDVGNVFVEAEDKQTALDKYGKEFGEEKASEFLVGQTSLELEGRCVGPDLEDEGVVLKKQTQDGLVLKFVKLTPNEVEDYDNGRLLDTQGDCYTTLEEDGWVALPRRECCGFVVLNCP